METLTEDDVDDAETHSCQHHQEQQSSNTIIEGKDKYDYEIDAIKYPKPLASITTTNI